MCRLIVIILILSVVTVGLYTLGAIGPSISISEEFGLKDCDISLDSLGSPFINTDTCESNGGQLLSEDYKEIVPNDRGRHIYYLTVPVKRTHRVMSRWYQYLLADLNVVLKHDYIKRMKEAGPSLIAYEVAIGYRDDSESEWQLLSIGNSSRLLECVPNQWGVLICDHFPLFELWSVYHKHYIINMRFLWLPIVDEYPRDNSVIKEMSLIEIHQNPRFTYSWFILKTVFFFLSIISFAYSFNKRRISLYHKSLLALNFCLLLFNLPVEWLSLLIDVPWITLLNDIRQGLLTLVVMIFWTLIINNHDVQDNGVKPVLHSLVFASLTAFGLLVYEVCERGIQVFLPFYSLWGSSYGRGLIYVSVGVATVSCILFIISLGVNFIKIRRKINNKLEGVANLNKAKLLQGLNEHLLITLFTAVASICGYILPVEIFLLHTVHGNTDLSLYGAITVGNFGLWNCYIFIVTFLSSSTVTGYKILSVTDE